MIAVNVVLTQMTANKGIKNFGEKAIAAAIAAILRQYDQLNKLNVFGSLDPDGLNNEKKRKALRAINLIKQKRCFKTSCLYGIPGFVRVLISFGKDNDLIEKCDVKILQVDIIVSLVTLSRNFLMISSSHSQSTNIKSMYFPTWNAANQRLCHIFHAVRDFETE